MFLALSLDLIRYPFIPPEKYEVTLTFDFKRKLYDIQPSWAAYLVLLEECNLMLKEKQASEIFSSRPNFFFSRYLFHKTTYQVIGRGKFSTFYSFKLDHLMWSTHCELVKLYGWILCTILFFFFSGGVQADADARRDNVRNRGTGDGSEILGVRAVLVLVDDKR